MSAADLMEIEPTGSSRLLADVQSLTSSEPGERVSALNRLEAALGRELADHLVAALSDERHSSSGD